MPFVYRSRVVGLLLTAAVGLYPIVPPEHAHEIGEDGRHATIVHRHARPHVVEAPHADHESVAVILDHDEDTTLTLSVVYARPVAQKSAVSPALTPVVWTQSRVVKTSGELVPYVEHFIHGPPRAPTSLRGPPVSPAL